jgi:hypothetical protein
VDVTEHTGNVMKKFIGWWLVMPDGSGGSVVGHIVEEHAIRARVRTESGEDRVASTAILDSRICQIYPSEQLARSAAGAR